MNRLYNRALLCATIVSDVHMDIKNKTGKPYQMFVFRQSMRDAKREKADAYITVGDTTSRGNPCNWELAKQCFKKVPNCAKNIILTVGNHDCWSDGEDEYAAGIGAYYAACRDIMGRNLQKPYFSTVVNGCRFICLGNESDMAVMPIFPTAKSSGSKMNCSRQKGSPFLYFAIKVSTAATACRAPGKKMNAPIGRPKKAESEQKAMRLPPCSKHLKMFFISAAIRTWA